MDNRIKIIAGALLGGSFGYFLASVVIEIIHLKREAKEQEYILNGKDLIKEMTIDNTKSAWKDNKEPIDYTAKYVVGADKPEIQTLIDKYGTGDETIRNLSSRNEEEMDFQEDDEENWDEPMEEDDDMIDPSLITHDEYYDDKTFEHVTLHFYEDEITTDSHGNVIAHPEDLIGEEATVSFGLLNPHQPDQVYIRNREKRAMYEVRRFHRDFIPAGTTRNGVNKNDHGEDALD